MYIYVYIYIHIYVYIHIYTNIYIYIYTQELASVERRAHAGLIARETIAKVAEAGGVKAAKIHTLKLQTDSLLVAAKVEREQMQRTLDTDHKVRTNSSYKITNSSYKINTFEICERGP